MNKQSQNNLKKILEERREKVERDLSIISHKDPDSSSHSWSVTKQEFSTDGPLDLESESDEVEEFINRLPVETQLEKQLRAIEKALQRIQDDSYGVCASCSKNIPINRLTIIPEAETCSKCA